MLQPTETNSRRTSYPIDPIFLERWSPRTFTGEAVPEDVLLTMIDAARWAPSSYNAQPARFLYARAGTEHWDKFFNLLLPFNQVWAKNAGALLVVASESLMLAPGADKPVPSHSHSFDAGCAWGYLALQALRCGWYAHGMTGFDINRAFTDLDVPAGYRVEAAIAIGRLADKATLPEQLQAREMPNSRKPLEEIALEGGFTK